MGFVRDYQIAEGCDKNYDRLMEKKSQFVSRKRKIYRK